MINKPSQLKQHDSNKTASDKHGAVHRPAALSVRSSAPKRRRKPNWPPTLVEEIRRLRIQYPNLGKAKVHTLLSDWCPQHAIPQPSVSTIGRIIAKDPRQMRHAPIRLSPKGRPKPIRKQRKNRQPKGQKHPPLSVFACDTVVRIRDGLRRYLFTFIDPNSRLAIAFAAKTPSSQQTALVLKALCQILPSTPRFVLSDNGSEFHGTFDSLLQQYGITHWWTYPRSPKMNAHAERFNRTIQENFVDYHEDLLFCDLAKFNRKMADWLISYNTIIPHHSLNLQSPVQSLIHNQIQCQRKWTHTIDYISEYYSENSLFTTIFNHHLKSTYADREENHHHILFNTRNMSIYHELQPQIRSQKTYPGRTTRTTKN